MQTARKRSPGKKLTPCFPLFSHSYSWVLASLGGLSRQGVEIHPTNHWCRWESETVGLCLFFLSALLRQRKLQHPSVCLFVFFNSRKEEKSPSSKGLEKKITGLQVDSYYPFSLKIIHLPLLLFSSPHGLTNHCQG